MFKFLRKYNKWILAVGGTLLMIVFLIPQAFTSLSRGAGTMKATLATVGPAGAEPVTFQEFQRVQRQVEVMRDVGLLVQPLGAVQDPWHWYLLTREARQQGLIGGRLSQADAEALQSLNYRRMADLADTVTTLSGVNRMLTLYQTTGQFSDRRLRAAADKLFHRVRLRPVVIAASADAVDYEPTDEDLEAHLDEWAEFDADDPEARFGYKLPNRVKLEWLAVEVDAMERVLEGSDALSGTALRKHWRKIADDPQFPAIPDPPPVEVPDAVRQDLLDTLVQEKIQEIGRFATNQVRAKTRGLPRQEGYVILPDDWSTQRVALSDLALAIQERFGVELPRYEAPGTWLSEQELLEVPGIGAAGTDDFPPSRRGLGELAMAAKEFGGSTTMLIQEGVAGPPLTDDDGNLYVFRIIDTEESRPPSSVDEVRDELVRDLRRLKHFEQLTASLDRLESQAERRGLLAVALDNDTIVQREQLLALYDLNQLRLQLLSGQPLDPLPSALPIIGSDEPTTRQIIEYARTLPRDAKVPDLPIEQRISTATADDDLVVIVYELTEQIPLNSGTYQQLVNSGQIQTVLINQELDPLEAVRTAFGYDALVARHNLEIIRQDETEDDDLTEPETEAVANAS